MDAISDVVRTLRALGIMRPGELGANEKVNLTAWDLGSGSGKAVLGMALLHPFEKVVGVEQDEGVHADSHERLAAMRDVDKDQAGALFPTSQTLTPPQPKPHTLTPCSILCTLYSKPQNLCRVSLPFTLHPKSDMMNPNL